MAERTLSNTVQLKARMKEPLRAALEAAAEAKGVSLNAEMVHRLEQSFAEEKSREEAVDAVYDSFGKLETFLLARLLANAIELIEAKTGKNWMDDPEAHRQTQEACKTILDSFRPPDGKGPIGIDLIFEGTVGKDAAIKAIKSEFGSKFEQMRGPAKFFRTKKKGG